MLIEKVYRVLLNITAAEMFSSIDDVIMSKLKKYFEGKCRENSFIIEILEIVNRSSVTLSKSLLDGSGSVNVTYKAKAYVYNPGDILANCEITAIEKSHKIICNYGSHSQAGRDHAVISISSNKRLQSLKTKQRIGVLVREVSYLKECDKITIYGLPYLYPNNFIVYQLTDNISSISNEDEEILKAKMQEIATEENLKYDKKIYAFIANIYYPYKLSYAEIKKTFNFDLIALNDIKKLKKDTCIFRYPAIEKTQAEFATCGIKNLEKIDPAYKFTIIQEKPMKVLMDLLNDYSQYIKFIRETADSFKSESDFDSHNNIWNIYRFIKK